MLIELTYNPLDIPVILETDSDDPDEAVEISLDTVEGLEDTLELALVLELEKSAGYYGHLITIEDITNLDLYSAVQKLPSFTFKSVEGLPEVPQRPEGIQT